MSDDKEFDDLIKERFKELPRVVQEAIVSADVEKHLRELAETNKLHLDQWTSLEDVVQMTLLGLEDSGELMQNIRDRVHVPEETAQTLAKSVSEIVFEPIRQELERQLEHPDAVAKATSGGEDMRASILADASEHSAPAPAAVATPAIPPTPAIAPATPPAPAPTVKVERASSAPPSYVSGPSHERKAIEGDPYREQLD